MGLDFSKIASKLSAITGASKKISPKSLAKTQEIVEGGCEKLKGSLDAVAQINAPMVKKVNPLLKEAIERQEKSFNIGEIYSDLMKYFSIERIDEKTKLRALAEAGIKNGLDAESALRGAKELLALTGKKAGKSAAESAKVFIESGITKTEIDLNKADELVENAAKKAELQEKLAKRKEELLKKYGDKLAETKRVAEEMDVLHGLLNSQG